MTVKPVRVADRIAKAVLEIRSPPPTPADGPDQPEPPEAIKQPQLLASGSDDTTVKIWDPTTVECVSTLKGHTETVFSVAWSYGAANRLLASGSFDHTVKIWDPVTGQCRCTLTGHFGAVSVVAWSHHTTTWLASGSVDGSIKIWDSATSQCTSTLKCVAEIITAIAWSYHANLLASGSGSSSANYNIRVWDPANGQCILTIAQDGRPTSIVWFGHGARLMSASNSTAVIAIFDSATGACLWKRKRDPGVLSAMIWRQNTPLPRLASGSEDTTVKIWDPATSQCILTLKGHTHWVTSVAWSHGITWISAAGSEGGKKAGLREAARDKLMSAILGHDSFIILVEGFEFNSVRIWDTETKQPVANLRGHTGRVYSASWSCPEGG